jgi:hypothetical protein
MPPILPPVHPHLTSVARKHGKLDRLNFPEDTHARK